MTEIMPFDFEGQEIRIVYIDDSPWWVASDVARALSYRDAHNAIRLLDEDMRRTHPVSTSAGPRQMVVISEGGLWRLVTRSRDERARRFERLLVTVILPTIARTGSYSIAPAPALPAVPQTFADALQLAADQAREIERQKAAIEAAEVAVAEMAPRAEAWDDLASGEGDYLVGDAAKMLCRVDGISTGQNRLYRFMAAKRWVYRANGDTGPWRAMQSAVDAGWLAERVSMGFHVRDGEAVANPPQVRVTVRGLERLRKLMTGGGGEVATA